MQEVQLSRFMAARPEDVDAYLDPWSIIENEGTFTVSGVEESNGETVVEVEATGINASFRFEKIADGYFYEQEGAQGPFDRMETALTYRPKDHGTEVTMTSSVSLGLRPRAVFDRIGAWKRKGEMRRALENLAADVE